MRPSVSSGPWLRDDPEVNGRRHRTSVPARDKCSVDCVQVVGAGLEMRPGAAPTAEIGVERFVLLVGGMIVSSCGIGKPGLDQHIAKGCSRAIEHATMDANAVALRVRLGDIGAEIVREDIEAGLVRNEADMRIGACGLRGRFLKKFEIIGHDLSFLRDGFRTDLS